MAVAGCESWLKDKEYWIKRNDFLQYLILKSITDILGAHSQAPLIQDKKKKREKSKFEKCHKNQTVSIFKSILKFCV